MDETPDRQDGRPERGAGETQQPKRPQAGWVWATVVELALAVICGYASIKASSGGAPAPERASTCSEWSAKGDANKTIQAREMLTALRQQGGLGAPETATAQRFAAGLTRPCEASTGGSGLAQLAAALYLTERGTFG